MDAEGTTCTCVNRRLTREAAIFWISPSGAHWATAKDCPLHGMKVLPPEEPDVKDVNHTSDFSEDSLDGVV